MKYIKNILNLLSNSFLILVLFGIITIPAITLYALSPRSFESTVQNNRVQVLGIQDTNTADLKDADFSTAILNDMDNLPSNDVLYTDISEESEKYSVQSFIGKEGYLARVTITNFDTPILNLNLARIVNNQYHGQNFELVFKMQPELKDKIELEVVVNQVPIRAQFDESGISKNTFSVNALTPLNLGLSMSPNNKNQQLPINIGVEIEIAEKK